MQKSHRDFSARLPTSSLLLLALLTLSSAATLAGQSVSSGSTGADLALNITSPGVTTSIPSPKGGGSVYNFTSINIAMGSTLKLSGAVYPGPIYFLAQGAVTVAGTIDLSGQGGSVPTVSAQRIPTIPGAGGYFGGSASFGADGNLPGFGPSGGSGSAGTGCGNSYALPGGFSGNQFLVPLVGGSGGNGWAGSGGAGGGALLIASSVSISVTGTISANGGSGASSSGGGAGGAIRLVAPAIAGDGAITAAGGSPGFSYCRGNNPGAGGIVRLEAFQDTFIATGTTGGNVYTAIPASNLFVPAAAAEPSIVVTSISVPGVTLPVAVPLKPTGGFTVPDVALNSSSPLTVNITAKNIPLGTIPTVYFSTLNEPIRQSRPRVSPVRWPRPQPRQRSLLTPATPSAMS